MTTIDTPVLIVGAGPVGLALAGDLGARGVPCIVVEQGEGTPEHPRASALNARTMEFMRRWGLAERIREIGTPPDFPHTALYCTTLSGFEIARIERPSHGGVTPSAISPERPQRCNQLWLDPLLTERAKSFDCVDIRYRQRFERFTEEPDCVVATVHDLTSGERREIRARYVADCSGGRSPIRQQLGIAMSGSPYVGHFLSIFVEAPELWTHHDMGKAALIAFVDAKGLWRNLVSLNGRGMYRFGVSGKEFFDEPDKVDAERHFRECIGKDVPHTILSIRRWTARNVVADRYCDGRVMLAGDAAHLNHPAAGLGLNTGLGDAVDLGWKLAAMHRGWGGAGLLSTYESERRPVGIRNVGHADTSHAGDREQTPGPQIAEDSPAGAHQRAALGGSIMESQTRKVITDGLALGYRYDRSPTVWPDGSPSPDSSVTDYHPTARPGSRAPHAWIAEGCSTIDLFGDGFVLLRLGATPPTSDTIESAFRHRGVPLSVQTIANPEIAALYKTSLVLVRPDGHVAWRNDALPPDPLALADRVRGA